VTPEQSRAARAWLNWSQSDLADRANVSKPTVLNFEIGRSIPHRVTLTAMRTALEQGGVRFLFVDELAVGIIRADVETGARRIADSFNFKENHAPEKTDRPDYPRVTINEARPGRTTTPAELEQLGLVAPNETIAPLFPVWRSHTSESEVTWARCGSRQAAIHCEWSPIISEFKEGSDYKSNNRASQKEKVGAAKSPL
jgi:transcriptional regulator with XRE-family HTH domain